MVDLSAIFGSGGCLARSLRGFACRPQQQAMAETVAGVLESGGVLICEAGTGTGKTFAYLVPALQSGRKVLISTGTRALQDQLFHRDLPLIRAALGLPIQAALLKGRANYLCRHRLNLALGETPPAQPRARAWLNQIADWSRRTRHGDIAELDIPEDAAIWPEVTSTSDNCPGQECPEWQGCHLVEARRAAQAAELVVVNHHLFCADLALKEDGFGELLPGADCFILDEAHQLPEIASGFFGLTLGSRQLLDLARDTGLEYRREAGDLPRVPECADRLTRATRDLRLALGDADRRGPWREFAGDAGVRRAARDLDTHLEALVAVLEIIAGRGKGLDSCLARARDLLARLRLLAGPGLDAEGDDGADGMDSVDGVRWFETVGRGFRLHRTPLEVAHIFRPHLERDGTAWILTSATLAVGDDFGHFAARLGITAARTARWDSPFDYARQALWFVPRGLPPPADPDYNRQVLALARALIDHSRGRAFLLFTSHRALREVAEGLDGTLDYPLLVQGSAPRGELIERFRRLGNAVLLGTASFWEGVDVRGDALSCVLIDRLPFASPGDPVLAARIESSRRAGGNPFQEIQLPRAVIALKQGAGRLIRGNEDRGVLVVCDPRLLSRAYGHTFLRSLPPMARTRTLDAVRAFFAGEALPDDTHDAARDAED